ncbi:MAG: AAA family ATPase [Acidobacteriota bacterium]
MQIETIRLKNFRAFQHVEFVDLPKFCVFVGPNGSGKSTLFEVFRFLREAMKGSVTSALGRLGGSRGFQEVRTRGAEGPIEVELQVRADLGSKKPKLITYLLVIDEERGKPVVVKEVLRYRRGSSGRPWHFIDFARGQGTAVTNELDERVADVDDLKRESQTLKSSDLLALKALAQFERFPAALALGTLIENWHLSDFHISKARPEQEVGYAEHLSTEGENLSLVIEYLRQQHRKVFEEILERLARRVPGIEKVESKVTEQGRVLLQFQDGAFEDPFLARFVSDGTIKMLAYLVLLHDPQPHPLLCVEEPENQLYPMLLWELAEEFRAYARRRGSQVFVSTHSPDFLNAVELQEAFWLVKENGVTTFRRASDDEQLRAYVDAGDQLGYLWKEGLFEGAALR